MTNGAYIDGKLPALLERTPYDKDTSEGTALFWASLDYVFVTQDARDRSRPEGVWHMMADDVNDANDDRIVLA